MSSSVLSPCGGEPERGCGIEVLVTHPCPSEEGMDENPLLDWIFILSPYEYWLHFMQRSRAIHHFTCHNLFDSAVAGLAMRQNG
jgi:hypothetical protein